jgi:hypothetical protein
MLYVLGAEIDNVQPTDKWWKLNENLKSLPQM